MASVDAGWLTAAGTTLLASGGFWGWLAERRKTRASAPADLATSYATLADAMNRQTEALFAAQARENSALRDEMAELRDQVRELQAENETCRADARQLLQRLSSFENILRANGIPIPPSHLSDSIVVTEGGKTTITRLRATRSHPQRRRKTEKA